MKSKIQTIYDILKNATKNQPKCWFSIKDKEIIAEKPLIDHLTGQQISLVGIGFNFIINNRPILLVFDYQNSEGRILAKMLQSKTFGLSESGLQILPDDDINYKLCEIWLPKKLQLSEGKSSKVYETDTFTITDKTKYAGRSLAAQEMISGKTDYYQEIRIENKISNPLDLLDEKKWVLVTKKNKDIEVIDNE